jgi:hypothetical protein
MIIGSPGSNDLGSGTWFSGQLVQINERIQKGLHAAEPLLIFTDCIRSGTRQQRDVSRATTICLPHGSRATRRFPMSHSSRCW